MPEVERKLLLSLHDVSPRHVQAVQHILDWLAARDVPPVALLVVPNFHGNWPLDGHPEFVQKLKHWQAAGHELVLHGYWHKELREDASRSVSFGDRLRRRFMTGGEGEFLALGPEECGRRLDDGLSLWDVSGLGRRPEGFIAPAWLHNVDLHPALWIRGFKWTENHKGISFKDGRFLASPVISWASRDPLRRIGSRVVCPNLATSSKLATHLRLAIHPHDFDWPTLVRSIDGVLEQTRKGRDFAEYRTL